MPDGAAGPVLVTGGAGFIGGYVTRGLVDSGRQVTILTRGGPATPDMRFVLKDHAERFATETASVADLPALLATFERVRPATVVHAASNVEVAKLFREPYLAFQTNVTGTLNVLEAARRTGVQRVVDISSIGVLPSIQYRSTPRTRSCWRGRVRVAAPTARPRRRASCSRSPTSGPTA
jgi:nucleoside-diphosphate-sugar epimerase